LQEDGKLKITVPAINGTYEGKLSSDGKSITGTFSQGQPLPLNLMRATAETAWTIPEPPPPPKTMPADAKPVFEVATIKPARPEGRFSLLVNRGGMLNTTNTTVADLIKFAYDVHPKQITGAPSWIETEKYDVTGKPDVEGIPSIAQLKVMLQKLLSDRFQLTLHHDKKELAVYAITVTKTGATITKNETNPNGLPGFGGGPRAFNVVNSTMGEFATILQAQMLDRPVVDQTGFGATRYNFILKFTPDGPQAQPGGPAPNGAPPADPADAPPDIYTAFQQQLGLKLESTKAAVDVLVIDRVEKPSDN
jgi:bla regulator protein blaR1